MNIDILSETRASYLADAALIDLICDMEPSIVGFSTFLWNIKRILYFAGEIKSRIRAGIILGGPEITPDNPLLKSGAVDVYVFGPGENLFPALLDTEGFFDQVRTWSGGCPAFNTMPSPYHTIALEYQIGNTILLETTRGCAYRCSYCYYGKAMRKPVFKSARHDPLWRQSRPQGYSRTRVHRV